MPKNSKAATVAEIAAMAGVSSATVSRVLNHKGIVKGDTYDRVVAAVHELGGSFSERTEVEPSGGLLIFNLPSLDNPFYSEIVRGAKTSATRHGYHLLINEEHINRNTMPRVLKLLHKTRAVGMVTTNHISPDILQKLASTVALVQCCEYDEELDLPYVSIDDLSASKNIVEHLLAMGRRRIAFISGPARYKYARHRLQGYRTALQEAGLEEDPRLIVQLPEISYDLSISSAMQLLNADNPPDAFFTASDVYAAAVVRAAYLAGYRVPQDLMVAGFDNIEFSSMAIPSITTVSQPRTQLGFMACELLLEKIMDPDIPNKKIVLETELIVRESTAI